MPVTNSTLPKRRRFQPPITSYFSTATEPTSYDVSHHHYAAATFSATPVVPERVQSSLLSVGMRVRKSVADGYKTQISMNGQKIAPPVIMETKTAQSYTAKNNYMELTPYSNLPRSHTVQTDDGDAYSLPGSQESISSTASMPQMINGQKRRFDRGNDIFADEDAYLEDDDVDSWQGSHSRTILFPTGQQGRRIIPLPRKSDFAPQNMDLDDDFEEASFLRRREEVDDYDMDCA